MVDFSIRELEAIRKTAEINIKDADDSLYVLKTMDMTDEDWHDKITEVQAFKELWSNINEVCKARVWRTV